MTRPERTYIHGTEPQEQKRLSTLNDILNGTSLGLLNVSRGDRILDVGSGLGQLTRAMARQTGSLVIGVEQSDEQLAEARRLAESDGEMDLVEFRQADAFNLPLEEDEWGTFDIAHARFLLEHVHDPQAIVNLLVRAVRPGGRVVLEDDDHDVLRLWPTPPGFDELWSAYTRTYTEMGYDPHVGRRLVSLIHEAGAKPSRNERPFFGGCNGGEMFEELVDNFIGIVSGARDIMIRMTGLNGPDIDTTLTAFKKWGDRAGSAMWYGTFWAEGRRP